MDYLKLNLKLYRNSSNFDPEAWITTKITSLNTYMNKHSLKGCIVGLSGGIDSAVTLGLVIAAMKQEGSCIKIVVPVLMPMTIFRPTYQRAVDQCNEFGVEPYTDTIGLETILMRESSGTGLASWYHRQTGITTRWEPSQFAYGQLQSYIRTPHLYFTAQLMNDRGIPSIVLGTGNADEDHYLGYFCKAGDGVADVQLINDLHKSQVFIIGKYIGVIDSILNAVPTADLWDDQTDEDELGINYDFVEFYTGYYLKQSCESQDKLFETFTYEEKAHFRKSSQICDEIHERNKHKLSGIVNL